MPSNNEINIIVTGRHIEVTDAIREFARKKIEAIHIDYPRIVEVRVVVDVQKDRHVAEIVLFCADHITIQASTTGSDLYAALDETVTKIMRRMRKHKTRLMKHFRPHRSQSIRKLEEKVYEEDVLDQDVDIDAPEDPKPMGVVVAISRAPMLEVMMMTVLEKSTLRPWPSVRRPSSRIWSRTLKTSGWAFSISSKRTTE